MSLNVDNIKGYVENNQELLISKLVGYIDSTKYLQIQNGVKSDRNMHSLLTDLEIQDGKDCGFSEAGSQTISTRTLEPNFLKVNMKYCPKDFYNTYKSYETKVAMGRSPLPLEEALIDDVIKSIAEQNERLIWSGSKDNGDLVDGFTTLIAKDSAIPSANKMTFSADTTVYERVKTMYKNVANKKLAVVMSSAMYRQLVTEMVELNHFHYNEKDNAEQVLTFFGTNLKVYGIDGITDNNIYGVIFDEMFVGMDNREDASTFDFWFSEDDRVYKLDIEWVLTVNYMLSDHIWVYSQE